MYLLYHIQLEITIKIFNIYIQIFFVFFWFNHKLHVHCLYDQKDGTGGGNMGIIDGSNRLPRDGKQFLSDLVERPLGLWQSYVPWEYPKSGNSLYTLFYSPSLREVPTGPSCRSNNHRLEAEKLERG